MNLQLRRVVNTYMELKYRTEMCARKTRNDYVAKVF